jgi:hypothetical protein
MVAYQLVDMMGRASAANILGVTVRELDKLVETFELSEKLTNLREPGASITWAREIKNVNKSLLGPDVMDAILRKINNQEITSSKDIRQPRHILRDPVAKKEFLSPTGSVDSALQDPGYLRRQAAQWSRGRPGRTRASDPPLSVDCPDGDEGRSRGRQEDRRC